ncbi:MAG: hypothetical protein V3R94_09760 [Acidobacteriota bacterium]
MALPLLVGARLAVTGITGYCAMEGLLARLPWNNRKQALTT